MITTQPLPTRPDPTLNPNIITPDQVCDFTVKVADYVATSPGGRTSKDDFTRQIAEYLGQAMGLRL